MVRRNVIIGLFGMLAACMVTFGVVGRAYAQDAAADPAVDTGPAVVDEDGAQVTDGKNPYAIQVTKDEVNAYLDAISETGCSTPSLECLVRNTTRFVAIEWVQEIMGPNHLVQFSDGTTVPATSSRESGQNTGIIASTFGLIGQMYAYQPATTGRYVAYVLDTADLAPPAYAQGIGFAALDPILDLWKMFRNVAYFFFIGVFIVIGFMIMFRQKISGQAAITAQQAIPSIIISLILVTFSYAISGFLIDMMYLAMYMLVYLFTFTVPGGTGLVSTDAIQWNIFELAGNLMANVADPANNAGLIDEMIQNLFNADDGNVLTSGFAWIGGLTLSLVLAIAVLIGMMKLFFELLKSYASIIMGVIFAPFYLMMGAFPGKNTFVPWLKNLVGNLAAFPTVLLFSMLYTVFTTNATISNGGFMPPYLIGGGQSGIAGYLLGLAIILALPEIVKEIKKKMGASESGFGWMVAGAAGKNVKQAEVGIPTIGALAASPVGAIRGATYARSKGIRSPRLLLRAARDGMTEDRIDPLTGETRKVTTGGARKWGGNAYRVGNRLRIGLDRLAEGRALEAEDIQNTLSRMLQQQNASSRGGGGSASTPTPTTPPTPSP